MTPSLKPYATAYSVLMVNQGDALEALKCALKSRTIDFFIAVELADRVKAGRGAEILRALKEITDPKVALTDLLEFDPSDN